MVQVPRAVAEVAPPASTAAATTAPAPGDDVEAFRQLGLRPDLLAALSALRITTPTEVQTLAIPAIRRGGDFLITSHTGSGKTLAFLLPIAQALKEEEAQGFVPAPKRPRAVILSPTKELAEQTTAVAKALSHHCKLRVVNGNSDGRRKAVQESRLSRGLDVVVLSPTKLLQHCKEGLLFLRDVRWLVIDEADTMFAEGWGTELGELLVPLRSRPAPASVVLVSATMTKPIKRLLAAQFPAIQALQTDSTHKGIVGSRHVFSSLPPGRDKLAALVELLLPDGRKPHKALVFCNSVDSCRAVEHHCREAGLPTVCYHGDMPVAARQESMAAFAADIQEGGRHPILVASDVAARGLDFSGHVDHVINFDFPYTAVDYIHRSGRTARAGRTGRVTSIVTSRDRVLAQRIEWALQHNEALDQLSSNPDVLPPSQRPQPTALRARDGKAGDARGGRGGGRGGSSGGRGGAGLGGGARGSRAGREAVSKETGPAPGRRGAGRVQLLDERLAARNAAKGKPSRGRGGGPMPGRLGGRPK